MGGHDRSLDQGATKLPDEFKDLGKVDLVVVTHDHGDHLGGAMEISQTNNVPIWGPAGMNQNLAALGMMPANSLPCMNKAAQSSRFPA
jgi:glyoxylase-like metal-dependent hydrolase (beta-lactamase superfamily II)